MLRVGVFFLLLVIVFLAGIATGMTIEQSRSHAAVTYGHSPVQVFDGAVLPPPPSDAPTQAGATVESARPSVVPGMNPGDPIFLIYWNNAGKHKTVSARMAENSAIVPNANEFAALPEELNPEHHGEPGFRTMKSPELYWLGSTTIRGDGSITYDPKQIEVVTEMYGWHTAGTALREHYKSKLPQSP